MFEDTEVYKHFKELVDTFIGELGCCFLFIFSKQVSLSM